MSATYSRFDTLSFSTQGDAWPGELPAPPLAVLATIPRSRKPASASIAAPLPTPGPTPPVAHQPAPEPITPPHFAPVTRTPPVTAAPTPVAAPVATAPVTTVNAATPHTPYADDAGWQQALIRIEAAIAPYSQVIVLLALLAAAGVSLLLLYGGPARSDTETSGALATTPQIQVAQPSAPQVAVSQPQPAAQAPTPTDATAAGPAGLKVAKLTPAAEPAADTAPAFYPTTGAYPSTGADGPVARLSQEIQSQNPIGQR